MGIENVEEQIEWELRRVAAAFEVEVFQLRRYYERSFGHHSSKFGHHSSKIAQYQGDSGEYEVVCSIVRETAHLFMVIVRKPQVKGGGCMIMRRFKGLIPNGISLGDWHRSYGPNSVCVEQMVWGLYRLGIEQDDLLPEFKLPLTAHEKLELRLSMPREFWPQKWLDEVNE